MLNFQPVFFLDGVLLPLGFGEGGIGDGFLLRFDEVIGLCLVFFQGLLDILCFKVGHAVHLIAQLVDERIEGGGVDVVGHEELAQVEQLLHLGGGLVGALNPLLPGAEDGIHHLIVALRGRLFLPVPEFLGKIFKDFAAFFEILLSGGGDGIQFQLLHFPELFGILAVELFGFS